MAGGEKSETIRIFGQPYPKSDFLVGGAILLGFAVLMAGVAHLVIDYRGANRTVRDAAVPTGTVPMAVPAPLQPAQEAAPAESPLVGLLQFHAESTGLDAVSAYSTRGSYFAGDAEFDFTIVARQPNLHRQTLTRGSLVVEYGFDGREFWLEQSHDVVDTGDEELKALNRALIILENSIPYLAWTYASGDFEDNLMLLPDHEVDGRVYAIVRSYGLLGFPVYHYVNRENGLEELRATDVPLASGIRHVEIRYDYGPKGTLEPLPRAYSLFLDREFYCRADFDSVQVNQGFPSFLFKPGRQP